MFRTHISVKTCSKGVRDYSIHFGILEGITFEL